MKLNFKEKETAIKLKLCAILEQLNQRRNGMSIFVDDCIVDDQEKDFVYKNPANAKESIN